VFVKNSGVVPIYSDCFLEILTILFKELALSEEGDYLGVVSKQKLQVGSKLCSVLNLVAIRSAS
jgi:hypothetical protein